MPKKSVESIYRMGRTYHDQGRWDEAALFYRQAISLDTTLAAAYNDLGTICQQQGRLVESVVWYRTALTMSPSFTEACYNLGNAYKELKEWREAELYNRRAIELDPGLAEAYFNLGVICYEQARMEEAIYWWEKAVKLIPDNSQALVNLAMALEKEKRSNEAVIYYKKALGLNPKQAWPWYHLGKIFQEAGTLHEAEDCYRKALEVDSTLAEVYGNLGFLARRQGQTEKAINYFEKALELNSSVPEFHCNLAEVFIQKGEEVKAIRFFRQAIQLRPDYYQAYNNLGLLLHSRGQYDEALAQYEKVLEIRPGFLETLINAGNVLKDQKKIKEAQNCYHKALSLDPEFPEGHLNLALLFLLTGSFLNGWKEYEWRWKIRGIIPRQDICRTRWTGSSLTGKKILLYAEQGLGDTLQFIRYLPLVVRQGGRVSMECQEELKTLFQVIPGIEEMVCFGEPLPDHDLQSPLLSLPHVFHTDLHSIPALVPYLSPDPHKSERWNKRMKGAGKGKKIGLVWAGRPEFVNDRHRSLPLDNFSGVFRIPGVQWFSLQKGMAVSQIKELSLEKNVVDFSNELTDFSETAALIENLDLVISVDTAVAHLTGALGKPVWTLLPFAPDWRWMLDREDSPWYPTMRLFRQPRYGDWESVIKRVAVELEKELKR
ncbi:MAG: tetratricopeptide repeat protein [Thermodesulfobacteriota bacterium]